MIVRRIYERTCAGTKQVLIAVPPKVAKLAGLEPGDVVEIIVDREESALVVRKRRELYTVREAAELLGVERDTLRKWIKRGRVKAVTGEDKRIYIHASELERVMRELEGKQVEVTE